MILKSNTKQEQQENLKAGPDKEDIYAIELIGVSKDYHRYSERVKALRNIDLKVKKEDQVVVTGTSGSGKSTFLHIIGALERPSSGMIKVDGRDLAKMSEYMLSNFRNSQVGFVFQMNNLLAEFTALENVMIPGLIAGVREKDVLERARYLLEAVALDARKHHRPRELSGGEQQRVAIARALLMDPGLLLADEPTGNLDHRTSQAVFELLKDICRRHGSTMLLITHDQEMAKNFDKKIMMEDGIIQEKVGVL
ncbi:MAG: ABC transporter ATP-binding protein [Proteobacteria bacterium]|nr:ABC transporter ATP-binding protein [Pseudomonadota bacterium]